MIPRLLIPLLVFLAVSCKETTESKLLNFDYQAYFGKTTNDLLRDLKIPYDINKSYNVFQDGYTTGVAINFDFNNNIETYLEKPLRDTTIKYGFDDILNRKINRVDIETENYLLFVSANSVKKEKKKHRE